VLPDWPAPALRYGTDAVAQFVVVGTSAVPRRSDWNAPFGRLRAGPVGPLSVGQFSRTEGGHHAIQFGRGLDVDPFDAGVAVRTPADGRVEQLPGLDVVGVRPPTPSGGRGPLVDRTPRRLCLSHLARGYSADGRYVWW
jgi:hypothetical protein